MGSSTNTTTTKSSSKALNSTVDKLAAGLGAEYSPGKSLYQAPSANTTQGWQASLNAANNPAFSQGLAGAMSSFGNRAAGNELGMQDPGYATLRAKLENDVMRSTNTAFNQSGLFGSDSNQKAAASGLADSLGALDYQQYGNSLDRQSSAAAMLPQLFSAGQLPASIQQSVGAAQDADAAAKAAGPTDYLGKLTSIMAGQSGAAGSTTSQPSTPLWQTLLGLGVSAL